MNRILTLTLVLVPFWIAKADTPPLADPFILLEGDTYYAYGTHAADGIEVYTSTNLTDWQLQGLALSESQTTENRWFWAPEVYHKGDTYYMYYSANEHLYVATSHSPLGPFRQRGTYMMERILGDEKCIDSSVFFDDDGSAWLFFVRFTDGNCIWQCRLDNDLMTPVAGTLRECIHVTEPWESRLGRVCEGPFVIKHDGLYYLTYSANDYRSQDYGVGYATASSLDGPWLKVAENPILQRYNGLVGCGHHSFFTDKCSQLRIVFHAHHSEKQVHPRLMHVAPASFEGSKLTVKIVN